MTSRDFCYWLQGFFELNPEMKGVTVDQLECIKKHLSLVFIHEIDPSFPSQQQSKLNEVHKPGSSLSGLARC